MKTLPLFLSALLLAAALPATAQQMNYQGRLTDGSGNALTDGRYTVEFSLWDAATGGTQIWGPYVLDGAAGNGHAPQVELVNGRFNTVLGSVDTANRPLVNAFAATRYLQIKVGTNLPITPRQVILDAPSALSARTAEFAQTALAAQTAEFANRIPNVYADTDRVGIGTDAPKQTLHINGDTYAKGHVWLHAYEGDGNSGTAYIQARDNSTTSNLNMILRTKFGSTLRDAVTINYFGEVTIPGTITTDSRLLANAGIKVAGLASIDGRMIVENTTGTDCQIISDLTLRAPGSRPLLVETSTGTQLLTVNNGTSGSTMYFYGTAYKPGGGSWAATSDIRLKKDVRDLTGALPKLLQLHSVTFDYKEPEKIGAKGRQTGFIAQEVEKIFPEWVTEGPLPGKDAGEENATKYKSISVSGFESLTVQALRELREEKDTQIKTLTAENTTLRDTVKAQEARLAKLEQAVASLATVEDKPAKSTARR